MEKMRRRAWMRIMAMLLAVVLVGAMMPTEAFAATYVRGKMILPFGDFPCQIHL